MNISAWTNAALPHDGPYVPADFARTLERELTSAQAALAAKDREIACIKSKADECWGAANYRLKYLACLFRALGRPDNETIENNISAAVEQIKELKARAEKALTRPA